MNDLVSALSIDRSDRTPISLQLSLQLRWLVAGGKLVAGDHLPPLRSLAADLGMSIHTVRAAYRHLAEDGLVTTGQGIGTIVRPRDPGRRASTPRRDAIGVLVPSFDGLYQRFLDGAGLGAETTSSLVMAIEVRESQVRGRDAARRLRDMGVAGIVAAVPVLDPATIDEVRSSTTPLVVCDWPAAPVPGVDYELAPTIREVVHHLESEGHSVIGLLAPPADWENMSQIHDAVREAASDSIIVHLPVFDFTMPAGARALTDLDIGPRAPTAILATGELLARGAIRGALRRGLRIPADLAVAAIGIDPAPSMEPTPTGIRLPAAAAGRIAVGMLARVRRGEEIGRVSLDCDLVLGWSCGPHSRDDDSVP